LSHPVPPLIERGRILMNISFLGSSKREIKNVNKGKVGAPFEYPHSKKTTLRISLGFFWLITKELRGIWCQNKVRFRNYHQSYASFHLRPIADP
jgi:hypothetical protein